MSEEMKVLKKATPSTGVVRVENQKAEQKSTPLPAVVTAAAKQLPSASSSRTTVIVPRGKFPSSPTAIPCGVLTAGPLFRGSMADTVGGSSGGVGCLRIRNPHPHDVLCGRGGSINSHVGNIRFRDWVKVRKEKYNLATSKSSKARMCREVYNLVKELDPPGRFLQRMDDGHGAGAGAGIMGGPVSGWWIEINEQKALAKTSQALREGAPRIREMHKSTSPPPHQRQQQQPQPAASSHAANEKKKDSEGVSRGAKRKVLPIEHPTKRVKIEGNRSHAGGALNHPGQPVPYRSLSQNHDLFSYLENGNSVTSSVELPTAAAAGGAAIPNGIPPSSSSSPSGASSIAQFEKHKAELAAAALAAAAAPNNAPGQASATITPGTEFTPYSATMVPVSPLFLSPIGNGAFQPGSGGGTSINFENPPALSLGDPAQPTSSNFSTLASSSAPMTPLAPQRRLVRSHSLENHELDMFGSLGGGYEFEDPFKDESHILSGQALRSPRPSNKGNGSFGGNHVESGGREGNNCSIRSVDKKAVHNIIERDDFTEDEGVWRSNENCFCLCGSPGNNCICSDLADHLLHRSDGLEELNIILG